MKKKKNTAERAAFARWRRKAMMCVTLPVNIAPCPFCGGLSTATLLPHGDDLFFVICDGNRGGCGASTGRRGSAREVLDLWNTRGGVLLFEQEERVKKFFTDVLSVLKHRRFSAGPLARPSAAASGGR